MAGTRDQDAFICLKVSGKMSHPYLWSCASEAQRESGDSSTEARRLKVARATSGRGAGREA